MNKEELNYLNLLKEILINGEVSQDRTGVGTKSIFGTTLRFSLKDNTIPLLTTKKIFWKGVVEELLFFLRGETQTKKLEEKGVNIWKGNTSKEFIAQRGLDYLVEGDMGKGYGFQWRRFGESGAWKYGFEYLGDGIITGVDQIKNLIDSLKNDPYSRRHIVTAWNPQQLDEMVLPPCHWSFQCYVRNGELSLLWNQRSVDTFLGLPFNIASYGLLAHILANTCGLKAKEIIFNGGDTHLYSNTIEQCYEQMSREPFEFPKLNINSDLRDIEDIENLNFNNFDLINYQSHPAIKAVMAV